MSFSDIQETKETLTGFDLGFGATGKFWAHEHWNLSSSPDMVVFSKKAGTAGYFFGNPLLVPDRGYRQFNT